jgi:hypothetical protein
MASNMLGFTKNHWEDGYCIRHTLTQSGGAANTTSPELMKLTSMVWRWCHEGGVITLTDTDMLDNTIAGFRALAPADALEFYHLMATDAPAVARHALEWHTARL